MKGLFSFFRSILLLFMFTFQAHAKAVETDPVRLPGHVPHQIFGSSLVDHLDDDAKISFIFTFPVRDEKALEDFIKRLYDPNDQEYGKYLTPYEFAERFSPSQEDYDRVSVYAKSLGLTVTETYSNRLLLDVEGRVRDIEAAFNLELNHYRSHDGRTFYAPNNDPVVPAYIASIIDGIIGLDNQAVWHSYHKEIALDESFMPSNASFPSGPNGGFAPKDIASAYNLNNMTADGSGQAIALFELGGYSVNDINAYTSFFGLPNAKLQNVYVGAGGGGKPDPEVTLDIELALALAPASTIYVYEGPNSNQGVIRTYNKIAVDNLAKQVSTSWGAAESQSTNQQLRSEKAIFQQMATQGQSIFAAAGDSGAYDDDSDPSLLVVDDPASQPYVVGVGGTKLVVDPNSGARQNEVVWNEGMKNGAGGGGVSSFWPIPSWQTNVSSTRSKTYRNVPDVSLNADPKTGYAIYFKGKWTIFGGTSCAAPLWSSFAARVNQVRTSNQLPVLGFVNPLIYSIGSGPSYQSAFYDIVSGNNLYYRAGVGYDNASGWGAFNGADQFSTASPALTITAE